jgi:hypothetical protein
MVKKRYSLYLPAPLARKFDLVAQQRHGSKSALFEEAMRACLEPQQVPNVEASLARSLNDLKKAVGAMGRDLAVFAETVALYVRYYLTVTPPLPQAELQPARLLGKQRFQVFVAQVGRRLAGDHRLVSEVLKTVAVNNPDLFAMPSDDTSSNTPGARTNNDHENGQEKLVSRPVDGERRE